jgi:hypothetical protein
MQRLLPLFVMALMIGATAMTISGSPDPGPNERIKQQFVGAWRLVSLEALGPDGKTHKADSIGLFVFTSDGHASVQVMERKPSAQTPAGPGQYSLGGYEATFGTYEIDEAAQTFTFHVEGALVRNLIGKVLPRAFEFSGKQLVVKSTRPDEHWKVVWERC